MTFCLPEMAFSTHQTRRCWRWPTSEERVLITEDKDFGELVFLRGQPHPAIVRLVEMTPLERAAAMRNLIEHHGDAMREGAIIVDTGTRVRIRGLEITESHDE